MKNIALCLILVLLSFGTVTVALARGGGGGFRGGTEFRGGGEGREEGMEDSGYRAEDGRTYSEDGEGGGADSVRAGGDNYRVSDDEGSADIRLNPYDEGGADVNIREDEGRDYNYSSAGPEGYRTGYIWRNGNYVLANCEVGMEYAVPLGAWVGWNIVTQPDYTQYPVYATSPIETAVQCALQKLGIYTGPIDGNPSTCEGAIEQYQAQNDMAVTGTITAELLSRLGIQATPSL